MTNKPEWYKFKRFAVQRLFDWLEKTQPELASWWDGSHYSIADKFTWGGDQDEDIVLELRNSNGDRRTVAYQLVEIVCENPIDQA